MTITVLPDYGNIDAYFLHEFYRDGQMIHHRIEVVTEDGQVHQDEMIQAHLLPRLAIFGYVLMNDEETAKLMEACGNDVIYQAVDEKFALKGITRKTTCYFQAVGEK